MTILAVVAHGGAGPGPERNKNVEIAVKGAAEILQSGGSAVDAAVKACIIMENDPVFNAGTGSVVRTDGSVLLDASIQTCDGRIGFVIAIENTPNPIELAAALLDEEVNGLTGNGAREWADSMGFENSIVQGRSPTEGIGDTIGVITRDKDGYIACATSTGGCSYRPPGRVGDVPLPGSGFWVEKGISVAATGNGEEITKNLLSYKVLNKIHNSKLTMPEGMSWGLNEFIEDSISVGLIALGDEGKGYGVSNTDMPWSTWTGNL